MTSHPSGALEDKRLKVRRGLKGENWEDMHFGKFEKKGPEGRLAYFRNTTQPSQGLIISTLITDME